MPYNKNYSYNSDVLFDQVEAEKSNCWHNCLALIPQCMITDQKVLTDDHTCDHKIMGEKLFKNGCVVVAILRTVSYAIKLKTCNSSMRI